MCEELRLPIDLALKEEELEERFIAKERRRDRER